MATCIQAPGADIALIEGPREGTLTCPACGQTLDADTLQEV